MRIGRKTAVAVLAAGVVGASLASAGTSTAAPGAPAPTAAVYTLVPDPANGGSPEGITWDPRTRAFYVGTTGDGTIYRGTLADPTLRPFILGGGESDGVHAVGGRLYVAGGAHDTIRVYDIASRRLVASIDTPDPAGQGATGFINDLVVLGNGDVIATDSTRPFLWRVTARQIRAGQGNAQPIPVGDAVHYTTTPNAFNLNGIVALNDHVLITVQFNTGDVFRVALGEHGAAPRITPVQGLNVVGGDGLLLDRGRLIAVTASPTPHLVFAKLAGNGRRATVENIVTDPTLRGPATVAVADHRYLITNAAFGQPGPFTVSGLPRR